MDRILRFFSLDISSVADKPSFTFGPCVAEIHLDAEFCVPCGVDYT